MKLFVKQIKRCNGGCPNHEHRDFEIGGMTCDWCLKSNKEIPYNTQTFPIFCELEDTRFERDTPEMHMQDGTRKNSSSAASATKDTLLIERLAAIDHDQWVYWSQEIAKETDGQIKSLLDLLGIVRRIQKENPRIELHFFEEELIKMANERLEKTRQRIARWETLWCAYAKLPDETKEHDRVWARKSYDAIKE